jgi:hypothetical protein
MKVWLELFRTLPVAVYSSLVPSRISVLGSPNLQFEKPVLLIEFKTEQHGRMTGLLLHVQEVLVTDLGLETG